jgi:glycosyltransferase involved in cell wall biosynthesis
VATDRRGIPDVVCAGKTGLLTPPDDPPAFAAAVRRLLDDRALRREMSAAAQTHVRDERSVEAAARLLRDTLP